MRRLALLIMFAALPLVAAAPAVAKEGAMLSPDLDAVAPGQPTTFQLLVMPLHGKSGRATVPAPRAGSVPVVVLRSRQTGEVMRFAGTPLSGGGEGGRLASVRMTIPVRHTQQTWKISVTVGGRSYPDLMQGDLIVVRTSPVTATGRHRAAVVWPFVGAGLLVIVLVGGLIATRRRAGRGDPDSAPGAASRLASTTVTRGSS
jgi:hypothetical protein